MASMESSEDEPPQSLIKRTVDTALTPFQTATSKTAQKAYLGTFLLFTTSLALICISTIAYWLFYYNFVPQLSLERVVHLQFGHGHPYGTAVLGSELASLQAYDVSVSLQLPRTPSNLAAGNFMLDLSLYARPQNTIITSNTSEALLATSRRPAILTYASPLVETSNKVAQIPMFVLGWRKEAETLEVPMMERVEFAKGWRNLPASLQLTLDSGTVDLQVYTAKVKFIARFSGLRWIMYNYRLLSFLAFTSTFWSVSMTSATIAWVILSMYLSSTPTPPKKEEEPTANGHANGSIKAESEEPPIDVFSTESLSDSQRTFPSFGRQMPLRFPLPGRTDTPIKREGEEPVERIERTTMIEPLLGEADDEDEEEEGEKRGRSDSGLGTSLDERRAGVQRRRSRLFGDERKGDE